MSASTQNQALNGVVFLYREVLAMDLGNFGDFVRAKRPARLPAVLTREECNQLFAEMAVPMKWIAQLLYGSGLRLMECLRLRVKDVDFGRGLITVRSGKGDKDRVTMLPVSLHSVLREPSDCSARHWSGSPRRALEPSLQGLPELAHRANIARRKAGRAGRVRIKRSPNRPNNHGRQWERANCWRCRLRAPPLQPKSFS